MDGIGIEELRLINRFLRTLAIDLQKQGRRSEEIEKILEMERERIYQDIELQESLNKEIDVRLVLQNHANQLGIYFADVRPQRIMVNLQQIRVHSQNFMSKLVSNFSKISKSEKDAITMANIGSWLVVLGAWMTFLLPSGKYAFPYIIYVFMIGFFWTWNSLRTDIINHHLWIQHLTWSVLWVVVAFSADATASDFYSDLANAGLFDVFGSYYDSARILAVVAGILASALFVGHLAAAILILGSLQGGKNREKLAKTEVLLKTAMLGPPAILIVWFSIGYSGTDLFPFVSLPLIFVFFWLLYRVAPLNALIGITETDSTKVTPIGTVMKEQPTSSQLKKSLLKEANTEVPSAYAIEARKQEFEEEFGIPYSQAAYVKIGIDKRRMKRYFKPSIFSRILSATILISFVLALLISADILPPTLFSPFFIVFTGFDQPSTVIPIFILIGIGATLLKLLVYLRNRRRNRVAKKVLSQLLIYDNKLIPSTAITTIYGLTPSSTINMIRRLIIEEIITLDFYPENPTERMGIKED